MSKIKWWGYIHANGRPHLKRYWGDPRDLQDARESSFCTHVYGPFEASNQKEASAVLYQLHVVDRNLCRNCLNPIEEGQADIFCIECNDK